MKTEVPERGYLKFQRLLVLELGGDARLGGVFIKTYLLVCTLCRFKARSGDLMCDIMQQILLFPRLPLSLIPSLL